MEQGKLAITAKAFADEASKLLMSRYKVKPHKVEIVTDEAGQQVVRLYCNKVKYIQSVITDNWDEPKLSLFVDNYHTLSIQ
ncbi:UNVERIFIED_CONTAM: hypothetical protein RF648_21720 [Kocuria sp. CPCC 205274]